MAGGAVNQAVDFERGGVGGERAVAAALGEVDPGGIVQAEYAIGVGGEFVDAAGDPGAGVLVLDGFAGFKQGMRRLGKREAGANFVGDGGAVEADGSVQGGEGAGAGGDHGGHGAGVVGTEGIANARGVHDAGGAAVVQVGGEGGGGGFVEGVGLVEDQDAVGREGHAGGFAPGAAELGVGEDEVVVGDDDVGLTGSSAGFLGPAVAVEGAEVALAGVDAAGEVGEDVGGGVGAEFGHVAGSGGGGPGLDIRQPFAEEEVRRLDLFVQGEQAEVVGAAFQQGGLGGDARDARRQRQVVGPQLVLEGLGGGADDGAVPGAQDRNEVGEGLAGAGVGFDDAAPALIHDAVDELGHLDLAGAGLVAGEMFSERAAWSEERPQVGRRVGRRCGAGGYGSSRRVGRGPRRGSPRKASAKATPACRPR